MYITTMLLYIYSLVRAGLHSNLKSPIYHPIKIIYTAKKKKIIIIQNGGSSFDRHF